jgi:hypothetical protein
MISRKSGIAIVPRVLLRKMTATSSRNVLLASSSWIKPNMEWDSGGAFMHDIVAGDGRGFLLGEGVKKVDDLPVCFLVLRELSPVFLRSLAASPKLVLDEIQTCWCRYYACL